MTIVTGESEPESIGGCLGAGSEPCVWPQQDAKGREWQQLYL